MKNEPIALTKPAILFLTLYFLLISPLQAQTDSSTVHTLRRFDYDQIYSTNHWNLFLRPSVIFAPIGNSYFSHSNTWFKMEPSPMVTFGWMYEVNFQDSWRRNNSLQMRDKPHMQHPLNRWGIQTGISMQLYWLNFNYSVPMSYSGLNQYFGAPQKFQTESVLNIPIYGVYRLPFNDKHHSWLATFKAGLDINIQGSYYVEYDDIGIRANGSPVTVFQATQLSHPNQTNFVYPSFHASAGINYILPNKKILNLQIVGNYSPFYKEVTNFTFMPGTTQQWSGSSTRTLSYAGVELNYIFTRVRRMKLPGDGYTYLTKVEKKLRAAHMYPYDGDTLPLRKRHYTYDRIFSTNHTNFVLQFNCIPSGYTYSKTAGLSLRQRPSFGPEIGWVYQVNFRKRWGLQTGLRAEFESDAYDLFISKAYSGYSTNVKYGLGEATLTSITIPVYACYYVPFHDKHENWLANFKLGLDLKYGFNLSSLGTSSVQYQDPVSLQTSTAFSYTETHNGVSLFAALHASAGVNYILPNKKMLNLQIIGCWSPLYNNNIAYSFMPGTAKEVDGSFNRGYSYIGFQLNYILTNPLHMKKQSK